MSFTLFCDSIDRNVLLSYIALLSFVDIMIGKSIVANQLYAAKQKTHIN